MSVEEEKKGVDNIIETAKWDMYGEEWGQAEANLKSAKITAIRLKDKVRIDIILDLLKKASTKEKVPV